MIKRIALVLLTLGILAFLFLRVSATPSSSEEIGGQTASAFAEATPTPDDGIWGSTDWRNVLPGNDSEEGTFRIDTFSDLVASIKEGQIVSLEISAEDVTITTIEDQRFILDIGEGDLIERLLLLGVTEEQLSEITISYSAPASGWANWLLINFLIGAVIFGGFILIMRRSPGAGGAGGGPFGVGKSGAKMVTADQPQVTFEDVAGLPEAKEELAEIVDFLKDPEKFMALGARIPKGVILFGHPGCGKTLMARAVSGEAAVPFFSISGSQFVEMFVGVGASRVRNLFEEAKKHAPCIVFVDEIDGVGGQRGLSVSGSGQEHNQTLNELLTQMDGFEPTTNIVVVAATNRPELLDPALTRPGRFDRRIAIDRPDVKAREEIFDVHVRGKPLASDVSTKKLAQATPGFTGADIENTVNEAAILAVRRGKTEIGMAEFEEAALKSIAGSERKSRVFSEKERKTIAYHEVGHALAMHYTPGADPVHKISIISRGLALGFTMPLPEEDRNLASREWVVGEIIGLLGGRAAEELVFGEPAITSGASNDLQRATGYARQMVTEWGMSRKVGLRSFVSHPGSSDFEAQLRGEKRYSEELLREVDEEIKKILDTAYAKAKEIISEHREDLEKVVERLFEVETMEREEFLSLVS